MNVAVVVLIVAGFLSNPLQAHAGNPGHVRVLGLKNEPFSGHITVLGLKAEPVMIAFTKGLTTLEAFNLARGDFNDFGGIRHVKVIRGRQVTTVDLQKAARNHADDFPLQPGDIIRIQEGFW